MRNKIVFLVTSRYPTEKAYGVTIGRTCQALRELGFDSEIVGPIQDLSNSDNYGNKLSSIFGQNNWLSWMYKVSITNPINYVVWLFLYGLVSVRMFRNFEGVLIYREVYLILFPALLLRNATHILEIHHSPKGFKKALTRFILRIRNVKMVCIASNVRNSIGEIENTERIKVIGMGVPKDFFRPLRKEQIEAISICFLGKAESNGNSNGILEFTEMICQLPIAEEMVLSFVGLNSPELESKIRARTVSSVNIDTRFIAHASHDQIPKITSEIKVGLLPYPESEYHRDRFPIKALEYAALGLVLLVSDTQSHRSIIPASCVFFFDYDSSDSLQKAIEGIKTEDLSMKKKIDAQNWSKQFTYEKRAKELVRFIGIQV